MRRRCVPLGIIAGLGVLMLLLLPVQAQAKRRSVQANSVSALERATKKLEKTGGIIWLGNRTYRLKKSIMIPSNVTIRGRKKTVIDGSLLKGRTAFVTKDSKEVHVRWIHFTKMQKGSAVKGIRSRNMRITDCSFAGGDYGVSFEGCYRPIVSNNTFTKLGQPIRFTISKKTVKKRAGRRIIKRTVITKNSITAKRIAQMKKNTVKKVTHYYVTFSNDGKKQKRLFYYRDKSDNNLYLRPETRPYRERYTDEDTYRGNTKGYYQLRSYMEQLEYCGGGTLTLKKGTYYISNAVCIPSNVKIVFEDGVVIKKTKAIYQTELDNHKVIFIFVPPSKAKKKESVSGYGGTHDVTMTGIGNVVIDCNNKLPGRGMDMGHCRNIVIENLTFHNQYGSHYIELNSSQNVIVRNCNFWKFRDYKGDTYKEAINIDGTDYAVNGFNHVWSKHDKTVCQNIEITNCKFTDLGTAIGSHTYVANQGQQCYHTNIRITDNVFFGSTNCAIRALNWRNVLIADNSFRDIGIQNGAKNFSIFMGGVIDATVTRNAFANVYVPVTIRQQIQYELERKAGYPISECQITDKNWEDLLSTNVIYGAVFKAAVRYTKDLQLTDKTLKYFYE
ncbi:MAG: right-handed parallel beta-helix repeat-containing protein [Eubacterium sp.]|nr:right-handed parallel beta-helix repeat-containing protein [Eubacterium sp.]